MCICTKLNCFSVNKVIMGRLVTLLVLLCVGYVLAEKELVHLPPEKAAAILTSAMQCVGETGVAPELLLQYRSGKSVGADKNFRKFVHCVFTKNGYADKTGHVKIEKALDVFPKDTDRATIKKVMEECNKEEGADPVEVSFKFAKCFRQKSPVKLVL